MSGHPIVHVEIPAVDPKGTGQFYAEVFGWRVHTDPSFDYTMFAAEGGPGGGFVRLSDDSAHNGDSYKAGEMLVYIGTDDIDGSLATITAHGGTAVVPKTEIPGTGWFAIFRDPAGNRVALYTPMNQ